MIVLGIQTAIDVEKIMYNFLFLLRNYKLMFLFSTKLIPKKK